MLNKTYKLINNKFPRFFKFIFFLRYFFATIIVASLLFLIIPHFFDFQKKEIFIKNHLYQYYNLDIKKIDNINYKFFPLPHLQVQNLISNFESKNINLNVKKMYIFPKLTSIYDFKNLDVKKIILKEGDVTINFANIKSFIKNIYKLEKKINFKDLTFKIGESDKEIVILNRINFLNYGLKKNTISGEVFSKKFKLTLNDDLSKINFKLLKTGITSNLDIYERHGESILGSLKGKVLKSNYKLDFDFNKNSINVKNFFFRDKRLSFDSNGIIELKPFSKADLQTKIKTIDTYILKKIKIDYLLSLKEIIRKINAENEIIYEPRKLSKNLINNLRLKTNLAYGRLNVSKIFLISNNKFICQINVNLLDEFPILYYDCLIELQDKKSLFKKINLDFKMNNNPLQIKSRGNINILKNKINIDDLALNKNKSSVEDLIFKNKFENILIDKDFIGIFKLSKIKKFIEEII